MSRRFCTAAGLAMLLLAACSGSQDANPPAAGVALSADPATGSSTGSSDSTTGDESPGVTDDELTVDGLCLTVCAYSERCDTDAEFAEVCRTGCQHFEGQSTACLQAVQELFECIEPLGCGVFDMTDAPPQCAPIVERGDEACEM